MCLEKAVFGNHWHDRRCRGVGWGGDHVIGVMRSRLIEGAADGLCLLKMINLDGYTTPSVFIWPHKQSFELNQSEGSTLYWSGTTVLNRASGVSAGWDGTQRCGHDKVTLNQR